MTDRTNSRIVRPSRPQTSASRALFLFQAGLISAALLSALGCLGKAQSSAQGSQTHFLSCEQDSDCSQQGLTCREGLCADASGAPVLAPSARASGVGDPCIDPEEASPEWSGMELGEVNIDDSGLSCGAGLVCLTSHFQGRVSCPDGQDFAGGACVTSNGEPVSVPVKPQLASSPAEQRVICSCRCAGPGRAGDFCSCPSGMLCEPLVSGPNEYAGSYCTYPSAGAP